MQEPFKLTVEIKSEPPVKRGPGGITEVRRRRKIQRSEASERLKRAVEEELERHGIGYKQGQKSPWDPMKSLIHLDIELQRDKFQADAANIIGGIADELQDILYANDNQLREIVYKEVSAINKGDKYKVTIYPLEQ